jgi:hypothetical protein
MKSEKKVKPNVPVERIPNPSDADPELVLLRHSDIGKLSPTAGGASAGADPDSDFSTEDAVRKHVKRGKRRAA